MFQLNTKLGYAGTWRAMPLLLMCLLCFTIVHAQDTPLFGFEDGTQNWQMTAGTSGSDIATSVDFGSEGTKALAIAVNYDDTQWQETAVYVQPAAPLDWSAYDTLSMDVYVPAEAQNFVAQLYTKTGDDWTWTNTANIALQSGEWTTVSANLGELGNIADVRELGIKFGTYESNFRGIFHLDNVRLSSTSQSEAAQQTIIPAEVRAVTDVTPMTIVPRQWEKFEIMIELDATFNNPYDPQDIRLDAQFESPSGETMVVPGFYYQDFNFTIANGTQTMRPDGDPTWRVRFTPTEAGAWRYRVIATTPTSSARGTWMTFNALEAINHGFIRIDSRNPRYFAFDDGTPYFPVGENIGWSVGQSLVDYQTWMDGLAGADGNFIRVWMASWEFGIEWLDTGLGNYERRQDRAFELDQVFNMARERDIYIMLSLINHGQYSETTNPEWESNPYNAANGGPLNTPIEFATNPDAIRFWHQRLRYIAARWGYSTNLMTWEWWNEINWTPLVDPDVLAPWVARSAAYLRTLDPYDHLITHSGSQVGDTMVWGQESMDFTQAHIYDPSSLVLSFEAAITNWLRTYPDKPFLMGEFGSPAPIDTEGVMLHSGLWSAPMNGAAGTAMLWWWDTHIEPNDLYYHFAGIAAFYAEEDLGARQWTATTAELSERPNSRIYGQQANDYALLWIVNRQYSPESLIDLYEGNLIDGVENPLDITFPDVEGVSMTLTGLDDGTYTVEFWDTIAGTISETRTVEISGGTVTIAIPTFNRDWGIKIKPSA
jgi:hypothetical protein